MPLDRRCYRLSPLARADLESIWVHTLRTWSLRQADIYHGQIMAVIEDLASGKKTGRAVDIREGYFKCTAGSHVVFYRQSNGIDVIRVLHQRMDVNRHL